MKNHHSFISLALLFAIMAICPLHSAAQTDMGAVALLTPVQKSCYGNAEQVTVRIKNYSAAAHNFATIPVTVLASVTGPNATTFNAVVVNTGSLPAGDTLNVVISNGYSMTAGGIYTFNANTSATGDVNAANNTMTATTVTAPGLVAGTVTANPSSYCVSGGTPTLMLNGGSGGNIQWQESAGATGPWANVGSNNVTYTPSTAITATRYYRAYRTCSGAGDTSAVTTVSLASSQLLSNTPAARCGPGTVSLGATTSAGSTVQWSTAPQGGTIVGSGNSFTTPSISSTTTYYASSWIAGGSADVGIKVSDFTVCGFPETNNTIDQPLRFTTNKGVILNSVYIIPTTNSVTLALRLLNSTNNITTKAFTFTAAQLGNPQQVSLNWSVAVPGNYQITNAAGGIWKTVNLGCGFPFAAPGGAIVITGSAISSTSLVNTTIYNGFYQINFTEGCQSSPVAVVATVNDNTAITQQPQASISTCVGAPVSFVVATQGANLVYQWRKNGANIANSNNDTLAFNSVSTTDAGSYDVLITGSCGSPVTSSVGTLNVAAGNTWFGNVSTDWNTSANWCAGVPNSSSNVTIFGGTPFQPIISAGNIDVRSLTIATGATMTVTSNATLNIYGDFANSGTFNAANTTVNFKGALNQLVGNLTAGSVNVNGSGITLNGALIVNQVLSLTSGNLSLGNSNLTISGSVAGTATSHIVTNGTGSVISKNISAAPVTVPVGSADNSYNPVVISNGGGRDYSVRVATGVNPSIANPGLAVNRTWHITPNTAPGAPVNISLQYADAHMNTPGVATNTMEIGVHNGTSWAVTAANVTPSGSSSARQVVTNLNQFGPVVATNIGGISWITAAPVVDPTVSSVKLLPNLVETSAVLRVVSTRSAKARWSMIDAQGRVVMSFDRILMQGQNDINLALQHLAKGVYTLNGTSDKGTITTVKFVKQ